MLDLRQKMFQPGDVYQPEDLAAQPMRRFRPSAPALENEDFFDRHNISVESQFKVSMTTRELTLIFRMLRCCHNT
jgi:hypothetical protein